VPVILQGSLDRFPAAELLPFLVSHAHSGTLVVEYGTKRVRIFLREGKVDWTEANKGIGAEEAILDLFLWPGGEFSLQEEVVLPDGAVPLDLDPTVLIEEGVRRAAAMRDALRSYHPDQTFAVVTERNDKDQISLSHDEFTVLFRIGAGRSLGDLSSDVGRPASEIYPVILKLQLNGLIREVEVVVPDRTVMSAAPVYVPEEVKPPVVEEPKRRMRTLAGSLTPDGSGDVHPLFDNEYTIGRDATNTIVIADPSVSSRHARVFRTPDGFMLEDLKSRNGTFVNGERVGEQVLLNDNDVVRFGRVILTFNAATEEAAGPATNPGSV
jgi:hypothetical protein